MEFGFGDSEISITVIFGDKESTFTLSKYDTIGDLKGELFSYFQIPPSRQNLQGWIKAPECDENILDFCDMSDATKNFLILYDDGTHNQTPTCMEGDNMEVDSDMIHIDTDNCSATANQKETNEEREQRHLLFDCAYSFIEKFTDNYGDTIVTLRTTVLQDAIDDITSAPLEKKRIILLYLNVSGSEFSDQFCKNLKKKEVGDILERNFYLIGYDLQDHFESALVKALDHSYQLTSISNFVRNKISAALMIVPVKDNISLFSCMRHKISDKDFMTTLKSAETYLLEENEREKELADLADSVGSSYDIGSKQYQQIMFENLGDRDFDCYVKTEHELLKKKIGYSLFGPPESEGGYDKKQNKKIEDLYKTITKQNYESEDGFVVMKTIFNCTEPLPDEKCKRAKKYSDYNPKTDICPIPVFVVRRCRPGINSCRVFIDDGCRVYESWAQYMRKNKLGKCEMVLPKDGRYSCGDDGQVLLETQLSPACDIDSKILEVVDISSTIVGIASSGILAASLIPALTVAPVALIVAGTTGIAVGAYSIGRSAYTLYDRSKHKESMSFADSQARGAYINILAGSLGFAGAGANVAVSQLAARGIDIGRGASAAFNTLGIINIGASGVGIVNSSYDVISQWLCENQTASSLALLQLGSSILFFGHAVYNFRPASTIVEESQASVLNDYHESLRSNRHRNTFNKLLKETIQNYDGDVNKGQSQVIKAIRNIQNKDEVFAVLTRNNKLMNKNGVKYSVENGEIRLNGYRVDINQFSKMNKIESSDFLSNLPKAPQPTPAETVVITKSITKYFNLTAITLPEVLNGCFKLLHFCNTETKERIIDAAARLLDILLKSQFDVINKICEMFPTCGSPVLKLLSVVLQFFEQKAIELEEQYENYVRTGDDQYDIFLFHLTNVDMSTAPSRFVKFFTYAVEISFTGPMVSQLAIKELIAHFYNWFAEKTFYCQQLNGESTTDKAESSIGESDAHRVDCKICTGHYYQRK